MSDQVELPALPVMYVESESGFDGAAQAFDRLEAHFPTLKGRKFYGTYQSPDGPYRACTAIAAGEDAATLGLKTWTIPGGRYRRRKLVDWQAKIAEIGRTFQSMAAESERDLARPAIEFYRSAKEVLLFLPTK